MPLHTPGLPDPKGLQLWIDLPKQYKVVEPSYQELGPQEIPEAYPEGPNGGVKIRVISGQSHGVESPVRPLGGCWFFHVIFNKKATIFQPIREPIDMNASKFASLYAFSCGLDVLHVQ